MRRIALGLLLSVLLPIAAVTTGDEQRRALPPSAEWFASYLRDGKPVSVDKRRVLYLYCRGSGSPTVILESGLSESAFSWWSVQGEIAKKTRVCAYDRAGFGKSPPGPFPRDTRAEVDDLYALLGAARLKPPYILVGHSMAGYNVRLFASRYLRDVAGIVLVDPSVENQLPLFETAIPTIAANRQQGLARIRACADPRRSGHIASQCTRAAPDGFPPDLAARFRSAFTLSYFQTFQSEMESFVNLDSGEMASANRDLGRIPLIVLTRGNRASDLPADQAELEWKLWNQLHDKVAHLSSAGENRVVAGSGHYIQIEKPRAVIDAVSEVLRRSPAPRQR